MFVGNAQAQSNLMLSRQPDFSTEDREFAPGDTIYMKVDAQDVDYSSLQFSEFRLISREGGAFHKGPFVNNFDRTFTAKIAVDDLNLVDYFWNWEADIRDRVGRSFNVKVFLRIGDAGDQLAGLEMRGLVQTKGDDSFVMLGQEVRVDNETQYEVHFYPAAGDPNNPQPPPQGPGSFADVQENYGVETRVARTESGELLAKHVRVVGPFNVPRFLNISGRVLEVDEASQTFVVRGLTIGVTPFTGFGGEGYRPDGTKGGVSVGQLVRVYGDFQDDGSVQAHFIEFRRAARPELEVRGRLTDFDGESFVVQGFTFRVTDATIVERLNNGTLPGGGGGDGTCDPNKGDCPPPACDPAREECPPPACDPAREECPPPACDPATGACPPPPGKKSAASVDEIENGLVVRVVGVATQLGLEADYVLIETGDDRFVRISGEVEGVSETGFSIRGWSIQVDAYTPVFNEKFEQITLQDITDGQLVMVFGEFQEEGSIRAYHIEYRQAARDQFALFGPVTAIDETGVTVWDVFFEYSDDSRFEFGYNEVISREDIQLGQIVEAVSVPIAGQEGWRIDVLRVQDRQNDGGRLSGLIENLTDTGFTVLGQNVSINEFTNIRNRQWETIGFDQLAEGKAVDLYGNFEGENGFKPFEVVLNGKEREEIEFWGVIASVEGDEIVVGGVPFQFVQGSKIYTDQGEGTQDGLSSGLYVSIVGLASGDGTFFVDRIYVPRQEDRSVRVAGEVEFIDEFGLSLWGGSVVFTPYTQFHNQQYQPVERDNIQLGDVVSVWGVYREDGTIEAHSVELRAGNQSNLTLLGAVQYYDGQTLQVGDVSFLINDQTQYFEENGTAAGDGGATGKAARRKDLSWGPFAGQRVQSFDLAAGTLVEVLGAQDESGQFVAVVVRLRDETGQTRLAGKIESVEGETLRIRGRLVRTTPNTEVVNENFQPIALADLVAAQGVQVFGQIQNDGSVDAYRVELRPDAREEIEFWGRVGSIQGDVLFVENMPFHVTEFTFFTSETGDPADLTTLVSGQQILVSGEFDIAGLLKATLVFVPKQRVQLYMSGAVELVEEGRLVVQGYDIVLTEWASVIDANYQPADVSSLEVGQFVYISGELSGAGAVTAHYLQFFGTNVQELELRGAIAALDGELMVVSGRTFVISENTFLHSFDGSQLGLGALQPGLKVSVVGKPGEGEYLAAVKVFVENQDQDEQVRMRGAISQVGVDGFVILGRQVVFNEYTNLFGEGYVKITVDQLTDGQVLTVFGSLNNEGVVNAYTVEAFVFDLEQLEFRGVVDAFENGVASIRGFSIAVNDQTFIQNEKGFPIGTEVLAPGTLVRVIALPGEGDQFFARWMQVGAGQEDRGVNLSGTIASIDKSRRLLTVYGRTVVVEEYADVISETFERIPFQDLVADKKVRVYGFYEDGGRIRAWRIESVGAEDRELELRGTIESIAGSTLVVRGISFVVGAQTWIDGGQGTPFPVANLEAGMQVALSGAPQENGSYAARWIQVQSGNEDRNIRLFGGVVEANADQRVLVIRNHRIFLNEHAQIVGAQYEPISFAGLPVNGQVMVWGWMQPDGKIEGWRVEVRNPEQEEFFLTGALSEIDGATLTVGGVQFVTTAETFVVAPDVGNISFDNLFAGLIVEVSGGVGAEGQLLAKKIQVYTLDPRVALEIRGIVSELEDGRFELAGIPVEYDPRTFVLDGNNRPIDPSVIQDNNNVDVIVLEGAGDALLARFVQVFDLIRDEKSLVDRIETLGGGTFSMRGYTFRVDATTVMEDPLGNPMRFADLFERMRVEVNAVEEGNGVFLARKVIARPRDQKLTGTLTAVSASAIGIAGLSVTVDVSTVVTNADGDEIDVTDLVAGQTINLTFVPGAGGIPVATAITLLPRLEDEVVLSGSMEAAFGQLFVVLGRRFQVIPNTVFLDESKNPITMGNFIVGEAVRVRGLLLAGDDLVALQVQKLGEEATDVRVEGPIVSVSSSVLEVMNIFFFINNESLFIDLNGEETDVNAFAEGQTVMVIAEGQPNGTLLLKRVSVQNVSLSQGEIGNIEGDQFSMFGTTYRVDENTIVLGDENAQLDLANLGEGQYVEVRGTASADGSVAGKTGAAILVSKVKIIDAEGSGEYELDSNTSPVATEKETLPETFELEQNYPNPFNPVTTIRFALPQNTRVTLKVFDVVGREVQTLVSSELTAGTYDVQWNGRNQAGLPVASGVYLYRLDLGTQVMTRRMVLVK